MIRAKQNRSPVAGDEQTHLLVASAKMAILASGLQWRNKNFAEQDSSEIGMDLLVVPVKIFFKTIRDRTNDLKAPLSRREREVNSAR